MASNSEEFFFGDFSCLPLEELNAVHNILHGPKDHSSRRVEFPWDNQAICEQASTNSSSDRPNIDFVQPSFQAPPGIAVHPGLYALPPGVPQIQGFQMHPHLMQLVLVPSISPTSVPRMIPIACPAMEDCILDQGGEHLGPFDDSSAVAEGSNMLEAMDRESKSAQIIASLKNRERRNKKVRPPDYYKKLEAAEYEDGELKCSSLTKEKAVPDVNIDLDSENLSSQDTISVPLLQKNENNESSEVVSFTSVVPETQNSIVFADCGNLEGTVHTQTVGENCPAPMPPSPTSFSQESISENGAEQISNVNKSLVCEDKIDVHMDSDSVANNYEATVKLEPSSDIANVNACGNVAFLSPNTELEKNTSIEPPRTVKSWAGLFKDMNNTSKSIVVYSPISLSIPPPPPPPEHPSEREIKEQSPQLQLPVDASEDSASRQLGDLFLKVSLCYKPVALQLRGLINKGNWCYINATLQALLACPPFYHLIKQIPAMPPAVRGQSSTPVLDNMIKYVNEFSLMEISSDRNDKGVKKKSQELASGPPFEPSYVYKMLQAVESTLSFKFGKQEDAEEFLSFVLNRLHEEMVSVMNVASEKGNDMENSKKPAQPSNGFLVENEDLNNFAAGDSEEEWEQVGPKNRSILTRKADFHKTPISDIFAGQIRSAVFQAAAKESATLEPFFTLQLDIQSEKVWTVKDALEGLVCKEAVHGYTCSRTNTEVEITRRVTLEELPKVLILHFKCFVYDMNGGSQKLMKKVDYPIVLDISKDLMSHIVRSKLPVTQRCYNLFAVVFHHGKTAMGGHYTTDVFHPGVNGWVHIDDSSIRQVSIQQVLKYTPPRVPYLLYYRRSDLS